MLASLKQEGQDFFLIFRGPCTCITHVTYMLDFVYVYMQLSCGYGSLGLGFTVRVSQVLSSST